MCMGVCGCDMCAWVYVDVICIQVVIRIALVDTHTCIRTHVHKDTRA